MFVNFKVSIGWKPALLWFLVACALAILFNGLNLASMLASTGGEFPRDACGDLPAGGEADWALVDARTLGWDCHLDLRFLGVLLAGAAPFFLTDVVLLMVGLVLLHRALWRGAQPNAVPGSTAWRRVIYTALAAYGMAFVGNLILTFVLVLEGFCNLLVVLSWLSGLWFFPLTTSGCTLPTDDTAAFFLLRPLMVAPLLVPLSWLVVRAVQRISHDTRESRSEAPAAGNDEV